MPSFKFCINVCLVYDKRVIVLYINGLLQLITILSCFGICIVGYLLIFLPWVNNLNMNRWVIISYVINNNLVFICRQSFVSDLAYPNLCHSFILLTYSIWRQWWVVTWNRIILIRISFCFVHLKIVTLYQSLLLFTLMLTQTVQWIWIGSKPGLELVFVNCTGKLDKLAILNRLIYQSNLLKL